MIAFWTLIIGSIVIAFAVAILLFTFALARASSMGHMPPDELYDKRDAT